MRIIDRLDDANLLRREVDELDHRRVIVSLTPHGRKFILALLETIGERDEEESGPRGNLAPRPYRPRG
jgi:DNA-binding MarR family transcriptional regulator